LLLIFVSRINFAYACSKYSIYWGQLAIKQRDVTLVGQWYRETTKKTLTSLKVSQNDGLSAKEVEARRQHYGRNEIEAGKKLNPFILLLRQFNDVLIIILLIAAAVSLALAFVNGHREYTEPILIFVIVIAIAMVGFFNEFKAEKTVEALKKLVGHNAKVRRQGKIMEIPSGELVPGDIVLIDEGQKIPADIRLLTVRSLQVNESSLTGESLPVSKNVFPISKMAALGDQKNMLFSGTIVNSGTAEGVVVATGQDAEIGKIAHLVDEVEDEQTPMQKKLDELGKKLGLLILGVSIIVFLVVFYGVDGQSEEMSERVIFAFTIAIALAVAAIPEGLSFVVRISLALGARRMAARNALVRRLSAVESLGSTDVVASDKTGTLTKGEMTVREIYTNGHIYEVEGGGYGFEGRFTFHRKEVSDVKPLIPILRAALLANDAHVKDGVVLGDPTEGSLIVSAAKAGLDYAQLTKEYPRHNEIPFSSERKMMSTVHTHDSKHFVFSKGAPDVLLNHCDRVLVNGRVKNLNDKTRKEIMEVNKSMAQSALRVLGVAYRESTTKFGGEKDIESKLVFLGLQGMMDPPRLEVKQVMATVQNQAGMRLLMITGDFIETAKAVAAEIGIKGDAITGEELEQLSQEEFEEKVENISVYARVNPEHKIRIVKALKKHGHQVAMTGDGVNDAPAIRAADIGIAMGVTGTDASKEAADLILLDDQFLTIIDAVEEGRGIFDNVRKFVSYLLGTSISGVFLVFFGVVFLKDPILMATHLLFINIVTNGFPAVALGSDPSEKNIMRYKPGHFQGAIITKAIWIEMTIFGFVAAILTLSQFAYVEASDSHIAAVSVAFTAIVIYQLVRLVAIRTNYKIPWLSNPWLTVALASSLLIQLAVLYVPFLASIFEVEPISPSNWLIIAAGSIVVFVSMKLTRLVLARMYPVDREEPIIATVAHT